MIFHDAVQSLREDKSRTFFYFLTFFITTLFMFLFFNIAFCEMEVFDDYIFTGGMGSLMEYLLHGDISNVMMIYVAVMCCIDVVIANNFFVQNKAQDLAVRLVCGATFSQLRNFLLIQTFLILLVAIPLGMLCAVGLFPLINWILQSYLESSFTVSITGSAIAQFAAIMGLLILGTTLSNVSYVYQNEAAKILNGQGQITDKKGSDFSIGLFSNISNGFKGVVGAALYLYPIFWFYYEPTSMAAYAIIGILGYNWLMDKMFFPMLTRHIRKKGLSAPEKAAYLGFFRDDFKSAKLTIYLFLINAVVLVTLLVTRVGHPLTILMIVMTYAVMSFMQALTLAFRTQTALSDRKSEMLILSQIGFDETQEKGIIRKEMIVFFTAILISIMIYLANIFISVVMNGIVTLAFAAVLLCIVLATLLFAAVFSYSFYRKTAFQKSLKSK